MSRRSFVATILAILSGGATAAKPKNIRAHGLAYGPFVNGDDPNNGDQVPLDVLSNQLELLRPYTNWVRTYGARYGLEKVGRAGHSLGRKVAVGAWIGPDKTENARELNSAIKMANRGEADMVIVGSEVLWRSDASPVELVRYIAHTKAKVRKGVPVTTAEIDEVLLAHPDVAAACDVILMHCHPYLLGIDERIAIGYVHAQFKLVAKTFSPKSVIIGETGFPSAGRKIGFAVPSPRNHALFFRDVVSWGLATGHPYFFFEAFDEPFKRIENPAGPHWGIFDRHLSLKPGNVSTFRGALSPDHWTPPIVPGGSGTPFIKLTHVPLMGGLEAVRGKISHVNIHTHRVLSYIYVPGWGFVTKPYLLSPKTPIGDSKGQFAFLYATGGNDALATQISCFLVPASYKPPVLERADSLPPELKRNALASVTVNR